jgi:DNA-binding response OmpR family regulator
MLGVARVLIIEDDRHVREALTVFLREEGHEVDAHADGRSALARLSGAQAPDAILLDLMMPIMNGWQFRARQLAQPRLAQIPTIVMTGNLHRAAISADDILPKPLKLSRLLASLERLLRGELKDEVDRPTNPYLPPLEVDDSTWQLAAPAPGESCRWMDRLGNWISLSIGGEEQMGLTLVKSSSGEREAFDSYEEALRFSRSLRG